MSGGITSGSGSAPGSAPGKSSGPAPVPTPRAGAPRQQLLLRAADEMHAEGEIGDQLWAQLAAELDDRLLIELCLLIGHYEMLAMTLKSLRVQPEAPADRLG